MVCLLLLASVCVFFFIFGCALHTRKRRKPAQMAMAQKRLPRKNRDKNFGQEKHDIELRQKCDTYWHILVTLSLALLGRDTQM